MTSSTRLTAFAAVIALALALAPLVSVSVSVSVSVATAAPPARADDPGLALTVAGGGGASLAGDDTAYMRTARNTTANDLFNLSFSMDVPVGVTVVSSMLGEPITDDDIEDVPGEPAAAAAMVRWVWQNAADLPASASYDLTVTVHPEQPIPGVPRFTTDQKVFPVGSSFVVDSAAYASSDPRFIPVFNGSTGVGGQGAIDATMASAVVADIKAYDSDYDHEVEAEPGDGAAEGRARPDDRVHPDGRQQQWLPDLWRRRHRSVDWGAIPHPIERDPCHARNRPDRRPMGR